MSARLRRREGLVGLAAALTVATVGRAMAQPGHEWRPWPPGKRAPVLTLQALDGAPWLASEQRGRVLLVNFWASWCEPCRAEMPSLARLARRRAPDGLAVVAANYREAVPTVQRFVERLDLDGVQVLLDRDGAAAAAWSPRIFPSTVVFDRAGRPTGVLVGEIDWEGAEAQALLEPLLAAPARRKAAYDLSNDCLVT